MRIWERKTNIKVFFAYKFPVVTVTPRRDFALQYHCSTSWISYCTNVHAHCTIQHCFYKLNTEFLYFSMTWDSLYMFSILIYFINSWIVNKQNSLSEWMWQLKIAECKYMEERVNVEAYVKNYVLRKCLEKVCDFTCCVSWTILCPRIDNADKTKKSC